MNKLVSNRNFFLLFFAGALVFFGGCETNGDNDPFPNDPVDLDVEIVPGNGVEDIDGNLYETILIGGQEWMVENLKTTRYRDGSEIEFIGANNDLWSGNATGAYSWYNHDQANKNIFGALYNWYAVVNPAGLCPAGWRIPNNNDWTQLEDYLIVEYGLSNDKGMIGAIGNRLKSCRQIRSPLGLGCATSEHPRWHNHSTHYGLDDFGFAALPIGSRTSSGEFFANPGFYAHYWSATSLNQENAYQQYLTYDNGTLFRGTAQKTNGYAVRCMRGL